MKVFTNHTDTVVAESLGDAQMVIEAQYGATFEQEGWSLDEWSQVDGDEQITICNFHDCGPKDKVTKTAAEWAATQPRGLLCSTEW